MNAKNIAIFSILLLAFFLYLPGLYGGFLFDDFPNLGAMTQYGDMTNWQNAKQFIFSGFSGPTGRPISLATFWLSADSWMAGDAFPFKCINLLIHILCGYLLFLVTQLILKSYGYDEQKSFWVAFFASSVWLLHPMFVSTTLYVVQRMTQLSLLFCLLGILGYLYGRNTLAKTPIKGYLWMTISIGAGTVLATFSKENGALLPLLILVIEYCNPKKLNMPIWQWRLVCLWLPSLLIAYILLKEINFSTNPWSSRNFNQIERLLSETRIVTEYLFRLLIPQIEGNGLYQDGYQVSRSLLQPISTLFSLIFLGILFISAFVFKKRYPLYALAILFFFAAHLLESTFLGLELYFEHRNYAAAVFLFLPLASSIYWLYENISKKTAIIVGSSIVVIFSVMTLQRAILWSDTTSLKLYWAQRNPDSPRAQVDFARNLLAQGKNSEANHLIEQTIVRRADSSLLTVRLMRQKIDTGDIQLDDFNWMQTVIIHQRPEPQAALDLQYLIEQIRRMDQQDLNVFGNSMIAVLQVMSENPNSKWNSQQWKGLFLYLQGKLYLSLGEYSQGYDAFIESLESYNDIETAMAMAMEFTQFDQYKMAYELLEEVRSKPMSQVLNEDQRLKAIYDDLMIKLEQDID